MCLSRSSRPVEHEEVDVYICESVYDESRRQIRPLPPTGLKHYEHVSSEVISEEVYFFKRKIVVTKVCCSLAAHEIIRAPFPDQPNAVLEQQYRFSFHLTYILDCPMSNACMIAMDYS